MISIGRLGSATAAADYYLARQAGCPLDYYTGVGERRGSWVGKGATALTLGGEVTDDQERVFRGLLAGVGPDGRVLVGPVLRADPRSRLDARPLVQAVRAVDVGLLRSGNPGVWQAYDILVRQVERSALASVTVRADVALAIGAAAGVDVRSTYQTEGGDGPSVDDALSHVGERIDIRRPGYDVVFSAPKSVSVVFGLAPLEVAGEVRHAHEAAVAEAMDYLERFVARGARGHQGGGQLSARVATDGLVAAAFEHRSSRAGDPQLHTHVVIANLLRGPDGQWGAVDSGALYRHQLTAGYVYQAVLRGELSRRLGCRWTPVTRGVAEIVGIPQTVCRAFSQRRQAIEARLAALGKSGMGAARVACIDTRPPKERIGEVSLRDRWQARAEELGYDPAALQQLGPRDGVGLEIDREGLVAHLVGAEGLTSRRSTFDARDVIRGICEAVPGGADVDLAGLLDLGRAVLADPDTVPMLHSAAVGQRTYSTTDMLAAETRALHLVATRRHDAPAVVVAGLVDALLANDTLVGEQVALVRALTSSAAGVDVVVGPAGAGKTRALGIARQAWESAGHVVLGTALAAVAAQELHHGAGIRSMSMARLLASIERDGLPARAVLVVDEASMIGTRQLLQLLEAADQAQAKVVLVGDPCQLSEIEAGGLFAALAGAETALHLSANQRQSEQWERDALVALRNGDPGAALDAYAENDRIRLAVDRDQLMARLTADYLLARCNPDTRDVIVLAARKSEVRTINGTIRGYLRDHGLLGDQELVVEHDGGELGFAVGDDVVVTRNDYRRNVYNGTRAQVTSIDLARAVIGIETRDGQQVTVPAAWSAQRLEHGYAMTCHRAQGITVDVALLYGTTALCREAAYVAMSRGRHANYVYATHDEVRGHDECGLDTYGHDPDEATSRAAEALGEAVARSRRQRLAQGYVPSIQVGGEHVHPPMNRPTPAARAI